MKTHICGNTSAIIDTIVLNDSDLFNVDHMVDLNKALDTYGGSGRTVKGNLDPVGDILNASPEHTYAAAKNCIKQANGYKYFLSPGCEVPTGTSDENMKAFCRAALG